MQKIKMEREQQLILEGFATSFAEAGIKSEAEAAKGGWLVEVPPITLQCYPATLKLLKRPERPSVQTIVAAKEPITFGGHDLQIEPGRIGRVAVRGGWFSVWFTGYPFRHLIWCMPGMVGLVTPEMLELCGVKRVPQYRN